MNKLSLAYNQLLLWLSHKGQGSYEQLQYACEQLGLDAPHRVRRHLQLLGHIEVKPGAHKWSIAPASWVQMPLSKHWFLCGQRSAHWLESKALKTTAQATGPDCWWAESPINDLPGPVIPLVQAGETASRLAQHLIPIERWIEELVPVPLLHNPSAYTIEIWNSDSQRFERWPKHKPFERGVFQLRRDMGRYESSTRLYYLPRAKDPKKPWLIADFTGLRFVSAYHGGMGLHCRYNPKTGELWLAAEQRWPYIYERCLILCSGCLPEQVGDELYYRQLPEPLVRYFVDELMDAKLQQTRETRHV